MAKYMYSVDSIVEGLRNPKTGVIELNRVLTSGIEYKNSPECNASGVNIIDADWDQLLILDACRYDIFSEHAGELPGTLSRRESKASATRQFLEANFGGKTSTV